MTALLEAGANVNIANKHKELPLHTCAQTEVLTALVTSGKADLEKKEYAGLMPLLAALRRNCFTCKGIPAIFALIDLGADVKAVDKGGNGVFHLAIDGFASEVPDGLVSKLCAAGADIDQINHKGEAPIHLTKIEISKASSFMGVQPPERITWFEALLAAGASLTVPGPDTSRTLLFNWVSKSICDTEEISTSLYKADQLPYMRLDPKQPNLHGRTPLHILSSQSGESHSTKAFDMALGLYAEIDVADNDGVTPLHLASTFSEYIVKRLLARGADPCYATNEGCTALHLAARCRMPNVSCLLVEKVRSRLSEDVHLAVNSRDKFDRTPLYYACLAGSHEMAKLLIESGAVIEATIYDSSPWSGLVHHEAENKNWRDSSYAGDKRAGTVLLADNSRPTGEHDLRFQRPRLDELVMLLINNATSNSTSVNKATEDAASLSADFTVECLLRSSKLCPSSDSPAYESAELSQVTASIERRLAERIDKFCPNCNETHTRSALERAWMLNDYHLLPGVLLAQHVPPISDKSKKILRDIVSHGFAAVLSHIVTSGGVEALDDQAWRDQPDTSQQIWFGGLSNCKEQPLLLSACRTAVSNMDVIRVLVEEGGHDPRAQQHFQQPIEQRFRSPQRYGESSEGESTLHALVRGKQWWQVHEGLGFLLNRGANSELCDAHGKRR